MATKVKLISESISPTLAGGTLTGNLSFGDNDKAIFGAGSDLQIYHNGNNSFMEEAGTGDFYIRGANSIRIQSYSDNEDMIKADKDGAVTLYHNNGARFATSSTGATVTGNLAVTGDLDITGNVNSASVTDLDVTDQTITLGAGQTEALSGGSGIIVDGSNASLLWDETNDTWDLNKTLHLTTATTGHALIIEENSGGEQYQIGVDSYGGLVFYNSTTKIADFSDANTFGLYDSGAKKVNLNQAGDSYFTGGNVGIGTSSPNRLLHISGATNDDARVRVHNSAGGQASFDLDNSEGYFRMFTDAGTWRLYDQTDAAYRIWVDTSGKVGIGKTPSTWHLDVDSTDGYIASFDGSNNTGIAINSSSGIGDIIGYSNSASTYNKVNIRGAGGTGLVVDTSNNVGIGEGSPDAPLHITSSTPIIVFDESDASQEFRLGSFGGAFALYDSTDSAYRLTVDGSGKVGIGTTSPGADLHVYSAGGTSGTTTGLKVNHEHNATDRVVHFTGNEASGGSQDFVMLQTGNVGIGTTSPNDTLDIHKNHSQLRLTDTDDSKFVQFSFSSTKLVVRNNSTSTTENQFTLQDDGHFGIGTINPYGTLDVKGAITTTNGDADMGTHTHSSYASLVNSGEINFTIGYSGTLVNGRVHTFTYEATSWKAWGCEIEMASTEGLATWRIGGYNNNSGGHNLYEENDTNGMGTMTYSRSGQHNIITITQNRTHIHPCFRVRYFQSGGDGAPRMDRAKWVIT